MVDDILADPEFPELTGLMIGDWGDCWEDSCQPIIDGIISHAEDFSHIRSLFMGDMDFEECEVSWIIQGDYSSLWAALPDSVIEAVRQAKLQYLGIADSEIQDELAEAVLESRYMDQISTLDLSCGTLTDKGGALLLKALPSHPNITKLDVHYHYLSEAMMKQLEALPIETDLSEQNQAENYHGEIWMNAILTELALLREAGVPG